MRSHTTSVIGKPASCILERLLHTGFPGKQTLKEYLTWSMFTGEDLWDQHLWKKGGRKGGSRREQGAGREKEKVSSNVGPRTASANPTESSGDRNFLQSRSKLG